MTLEKFKRKHKRYIPVEALVGQVYLAVSLDGVELFSIEKFNDRFMEFEIDDPSQRWQTSGTIKCTILPKDFFPEYYL